MNSFTKFKKDNTVIPGLKTSIRNGQVCSTGNDSLDFVIGGGIELNSILLIGNLRIFG
jgi:predicted ATP-dependent serine protease